MFALLVGLLGLLLMAGVSQAQQVGPYDACRQPKANELGVVGAPITVDTTVVIVVPQHAGLCDALIYNESGANAVRCRSLLEVPPTATTGFPLPPGGTLELKLGAQAGWRCIRDSTAAGAATLSILTIYP